MHQLTIGKIDRSYATYVEGTQRDNRFTTYVFQVTDTDGNPINLNGATVTFEGNLRNGNYYAPSTGATIVDYDKGIFSYQFTNEAFSVSGEYRKAKFLVKRSNEQRYTQDFRFVVTSAPDLDGEVAQFYEGRLEKELEKFETATEGIADKVAEVEAEGNKAIAEIDAVLPDLTDKVSGLNDELAVIDAKLDNAKPVLDKVDTLPTQSSVDALAQSIADNQVIKKDNLPEELDDVLHMALGKGNYRVTAQKLVGYHTITKKIVLEDNVNFKTMRISGLSSVGKLVVNKSTAKEAQFIVLEDINGTCFYNVAVSSLINDKLPSWIVIQDDVMVIDFKKVQNNTYTMYIEFAKNDLSDLIFKPDKMVSLSTVLPQIISEDKKSISDDIVIPPYVPVVRGKKTQLFYDNMLIGHNLYRYNDVSVTSTNRRGDCAFVDTQSSVYQNIKFGITEVRTSIQVVDAAVGKDETIKLMVIGESTSADGRYREELNKLLKDDNINLIHSGSILSGVSNHEARNGWGAGTLRYVQSANGLTNSFYNPDKKEFDLDYYYAQNPTIAKPDIVLINFGINDVNRYVTDGRSGTQTDHYNFFINQFKASNPDTIFVLGLSHSYSRLSNYWSEQSEAVRDTILGRTKQTITDFSNKEMSKIFLNPMYVAIDMQKDMQSAEIAINPYLPDNKITIGADNVHPALSGYRNNALMTYNAIKYALSKRTITKQTVY